MKPTITKLIYHPRRNHSAFGALFQVNLSDGQKMFVWEETFYHLYDDYSTLRDTCTNGNMDGLRLLLGRPFDVKQAFVVVGKLPSSIYL